MGGKAAHEPGGLGGRSPPNTIFQKVLNQKKYFYSDFAKKCVLEDSKKIYISKIFSRFIFVFLESYENVDPSLNEIRAKLNFSTNFLVRSL